MINFGVGSEATRLDNVSSPEDYDRQEEKLRMANHLHLYLTTNNSRAYPDTSRRIYFLLMFLYFTRLVRIS
jgi:hypothetical protein